MHPAKSVILFTVISGLGYGIINVLFLSLIGGHPLSATHTTGITIGMIFVTIGLLSSTFHLGRPERAWRALSQWRTSWLSREGVCAFIAFICPVLAVVLPFIIELSENLIMTLAIPGIVINFVTIHCTSMIYASLKPIPAWHNGYTPVSYQLLSLASGFVFVTGMMSLQQKFAPFMFYTALFLLIVSLITKLLYWRKIATTQTATASSATGLKGVLTLLDKPHSSANYLMKEMMFTVGRKHAISLRKLTIMLAFVVPVICYV